MRRWSLLEKRLSLLFKIHIRTIRDQIRTFKKDSEKPITEYLMHAMSPFDSLTAASSTMRDEEEEQLFNKMSSVSVSTGVYRASTDPQTHFNIERGPPTTPISTIDIEGKDEVVNSDVEVVDDAQTETTTRAVAGSPITMVTYHVCPLVTIVRLFSQRQHNHTTNLMLFANNVTNPVTHLLCGRVNQL
ncbi:hypothetical protein L3X38_017608 [Prunus dulcis]|uniref:Uncharacterized protein n=1 Tax=Prunus dulcis TaxID=3755 RepID=A0AAD4W9F8_PRUDU|nr:hypothetical protein L3X38_017608 [Prunus dulcis]